MLRFSIALLSLWAFINPTSAQRLPGDITDISNRKVSPIDTIQSTSYVSVYGTRYLGDEEFHKGEIWTTTGHFKDELMYRYDQIEGSVEVRKVDGRPILLDETTILMVHIDYDNKKVILVQSHLPEKKQKVLTQVVYYGNTFQLLRVPQKRILYKMNGGSLSGELKNDYRYFLADASGRNLKPIKISEKSLIEAFPRKRARIASFFRANDSKDELTLTKLSDLMKNLDTISVTE